ncbi:MAG: hypothetical protein ACI94Y_001697 [Maribacter sp.]|jgi:hypothetical protein
MRLAIIIIGVIGLIVLGIKWDSISSTHNTPQEGTIIKEQKIDASLTCPKCDEDVKIIHLDNDERGKFCKIHGTVAVNL